jgi:accessory gene regulator B
MKSFFIENSINIIKSNKNYDDDQLEKIKYGLQGIYLSISKFIIILGFSFALGIPKEFLVFTVFYNFIRMPAFGIHASTSYICLLFSSIIFLLFPFLAKLISANIFINLILGIFSLLMLTLYAPADTHKRPLINKKKRIKFKITAIFIGCIYLILSIIINNNFISNALIFSLITEVILILPITYKMFKMPYQNYKSYCKLSAL